MKLLVLGGTIFLGRYLVEQALERGHDVTLFHRGRHNPGLFPRVETILGDRSVAADLERLTPGGGTFDAVIDTCGYIPRIVQLSAERLKELTPLYAFVSSISVYRDFATADMDETGPLGELADSCVEEVTGETYGPLKALCEEAVNAAFSRERALLVRPGLIVGPHDPSDRFTYWPRRLARGGMVLAPERPGVPVQLIDVRDLAAWMIRALEGGITGVFNAAGPATPLTMGEMLEACRQEAGAAAQFVWSPEPFLKAQGVGQWMDLPLWISPDDAPGMHTISSRRAIAAGLTFRPLAETVRDTLAWDRTRPQDMPLRAGLSAEREAEVLAAWAREQAP